jgi:NodT family efflux transporter outer membrane factor (OMF) lipoprotein
MKIANVIVSMCLAVLVGCAVGPNYQQPKTSTPPQWNSLNGGETNGPVDLAQWWKNFGDTNLDAYIAIAIRSNLTLRVAEARVRESRAQKGIVQANLWPSLSGNGSYSRNRYSGNGFPPLSSFPGLPLDYNLYDANFDAAWELDVFGGTRRAVEAAGAQIGAAEYDERDVLISLLAEVARNYISARAYQERLAIARDNIKVAQDALELTSNRFVHGLGTDLDVEQSKALLSTTESRVPSLETGFDESVRSLAVLLGQQPDALMDEMSAKRDIPITPPMVPVGLPSELLLRRPDVQKAERNLAAATAQIGVAKADLFPKFSLTGIAGFQSTSAGNWFDYASRYWTAGPTVQWELFEAGSIMANIHVQNAKQEEALNTYQQTVLVALEDTENALTAYAKEQVTRESLNQSVEANRKSLELSTQLYKSGLADFIRVLNSEQSLFVTQEALVESDQNVSQNLVQLYKALGGGWEEEEESSLQKENKKL